MGDILRRREIMIASNMVPDNAHDELIERSIVSAHIDATSIVGRIFSGCADLETLEMPNVISVGAYAFSGCSKLDWLYFENAVTCNMYAFSGVSTNAKITLKKSWIRASDGTSRYTFSGCGADSVTVWGALQAASFRASSIKKIDVVTASSLPTYCVYQNASLAALILRNSSMVTCSAANSIRRTTSTWTPATIYVPEDLVDTYKANSTWANIASKITKIEGTIYEDYYANGEPVT